ncbi:MULTISPECIES: TraR/DksA family transcriptional regulator [unclassified Halomonas]|uniref:TraR/DksA family transcriptional regulator n=1 Tax=unclassified Halomonas TaxID=2609666 RepID=UPI00288568A7|nr:MULTISPECIES: TraR/DksA family transcriptional regulator [unclassified Halomonas]MDT0501610.1 TraR/DksA family transcriptional regulator [Halomonas sp. PAR7]MDT0511033.1 TraR/DksA family transcriptional regulator [Halomonas sp. LES1]MDT0592450.1 TraR/DksA family transcriptional regulator [Halomonas sp. PAR8]
MADNADIANELMERRLEAALTNRPTWTGVNWARTECDDCGNEIPAARRQAAPWASTCIECQSIREGRNKHVRQAL